MALLGRYSDSRPGRSRKSGSETGHLSPVGIPPVPTKRNPIAAPDPGRREARGQVIPASGVGDSNRTWPCSNQCSRSPTARTRKRRMGGCAPSQPRLHEPEQGVLPSHAPVAPNPRPSSLPAPRFRRSGTLQSPLRIHPQRWDRSFAARCSAPCPGLRMEVVEFGRRFQNSLSLCALTWDRAPLHRRHRRIRRGPRSPGWRCGTAPSRPGEPRTPGWPRVP
jgi:hypothetical protein